MKPTEKTRKALRARWNLSRVQKPAKTAEFYLLTTDSSDEYSRHLAAFMETFDPQGHVEETAVREMAALQWKILRTDSMQEALLDIEVDNCSREIESTYSQMDRPGLWALAFRSLDTNSSAFRALDMHQSRLYRRYHRLYTYFIDLRNRRPLLKNENPENATNIS